MTIAKKTQKNWRESHNNNNIDNINNNNSWFALNPQRFK